MEVEEYNGPSVRVRALSVNQISTKARRPEIRTTRLLYARFLYGFF
jgi:hypothetical protein